MNALSKQLGGFIVKPFTRSNPELILVLNEPPAPPVLPASAPPTQHQQPALPTQHQQPALPTQHQQPAPPTQHQQPAPPTQHQQPAPPTQHQQPICHPCEAFDRDANGGGGGGGGDYGRNPAVVYGRHIERIVQEGWFSKGIMKCRNGSNCQRREKCFFLHLDTEGQPFENYLRTEATKLNEDIGIREPPPNLLQFWIKTFWCLENIRPQIPVDEWGMASLDPSKPRSVKEQNLWIQRFNEAKTDICRGQHTNGNPCQVETFPGKMCPECYHANRSKAKPKEKPTPKPKAQG